MIANNNSENSYCT